MKRKLLLAAVTLFAAVFMGGSSLKAKEDVTATYLRDADLSSLNGWGNPGRTDWKTDGAVKVVEFWNWSNQFNFSQKAQLPAGYYRLAVNAFYRNGSGGDGTNDNMAWIFAGEKTQNVIALNSMSDLSGYAGSNDLYRAATAFSQGKFSNEFDFTVTGEGTTEVEIGFRGTCPGAGWCILGPVTLWQYTVEDYLGDYRDKVSEAKSLYEKPMNATVLSNLKAAVVEESTLSTPDDVFSAIDALRPAISDANTSVANYAQAKAILDAANIYDAAGQASYAADETIAAIQAAYNDGSLIAVTDEQKAAAQTAFLTACKAQTQPADGCNMTAYIQNWDFLNCENGNFPGWIISTTAGYAKKFNDTAVEYWNEFAANGGFDFYQNVTDLPTGVYIVQALMWNSTDNEVGAAGVNGECGAYGKSSSSDEFAPVTVDTRDDGKAVYATGEIAVIDGALRLGVKNRATMGGRWFGVDGIQLFYARQLSAEELEVIAGETAVKVYNEALAAAQAVVEGSIPTKAYTNLNDVITTNTLTEGTSAEYNKAAVALNNAADLANSLVDPYAAWKDMKTQAEALAAVHNNNASANQTLLAAISDQDDAVEAATIASDIEGAISTLKDAMVTYVGVAEPTKGECFDLTFMLVNPHFTEGDTYQATGWTLESGQITEHRVETHNFESWHNYFNLSQTIPNLPKGTYKVTLQGFARHDENGPTDKTRLYCGPMTQVIKNIKDEYSETPFFYSPMEGTYCPFQNGYMEKNYDTAYELGGTTVYQPNGMTGSCYYFQATNPVTEQPFYINEVKTVLDAPGDLKIGFKCETNTDWVIWDNFHLYFYSSAIEVEMDEDVPQTFDKNLENANVTLKRTIKEGLNSVVLPFSMTQAEVEEYFGEGSVVYVVDAFDDETSTVLFEEVDDIQANDPCIQANVPCILKATKAGKSYEINGRHIYAAEPVVSDGKLRFIGSYENVTIPSNEGNYILYNGELLAVDSDNPEDVVTMKGYRAYFKVVDNAGSRVLSIQLEDEKPTDIAEIDNEQVEDGVIYNLEGQVVGADYKGIAIINGKKVLLK